MPLTPFQLSLARLIAVNRSPESHLAGAAAIHLRPGSPRTSNALDYFHDREGLVAEAFAVDRRELEGSGFEVSVILNQPGYIRAIVSRGKDATKVEWAHDSAWRFLPALRDPDVGYRLHPLDLAINKVLALAGRDEPRDFLDALFVHRTCLSLGALIWAAVGKDPGYNPALLLELLARKGKYHAEDFAPLQLSAPPDLKELKLEWLEAVAAAKDLISSLPPEDAGCLYLEPAAKRFVTPSGDLPKLTRHRGRRGGVLPAVGEDALFASSAEVRRLLAGGPGES